MFIRIVRLSAGGGQEELGLFDLNYKPDDHTILNYKGEIYGVVFTSLSSIDGEDTVTIYAVKIGTGSIARVIDLDFQPRLK